MQFGVSLSAIAQQPAGADMQQAFADICTYVGAARDLGFDMVYQGQHYLTDPYQQLQTMPLRRVFPPRLAAWGWWPPCSCPCIIRWTWRNGLPPWT